MALGSVRVEAADPLPEEARNLAALIHGADTVEAILRRAATSPPAMWASGPEGALAALLDLDAAGHLCLRFPPDATRHLCADEAPAGGADGEDPWLHNALGDEAAWQADPAHYDFVGAETPLGRLKAFERDLYLGHLDPHLARLPAGGRILDAGCGAGRVSTELIRRGYALSLVDSSPTALKRAVRHALRAGARLDRLGAELGDVRRLAHLDDATFDACLAFEVLCYNSDPEGSLAELRRVTRPGGVIALSVEGRHGALLGDTSLDLEDAEAVLARGRLLRHHDVYVEYYSADDLTALVHGAGLELLDLQGTHYLPDGPLTRLIGEGAGLADEATRARALALERRCAADPVLAPLARSWLAVCAVP